MNPELEDLKKSLHPEVSIDIIGRCRIVAQALSPEGDYPSQQFKLADYLGVSRNLVYKMLKIHTKMIGQLKDWLKTTPYTVDTSYKLSTMDPADQLKFVNLDAKDKVRFLREFKKSFIPPKVKSAPVVAPGKSALSIGLAMTAPDPPPTEVNP